MEVSEREASLQAADIGHAAKGWENHERWSRRVRADSELARLVGEVEGLSAALVLGPSSYFGS